jgi:SNF2 family DNA or RNA helicase
MKTLNDFHEPNIQRALVAQRWIYNDEVGCGKSRQALEVCRRIGAKYVLIVTPAMVRANWKREVCKWLPERATDVAVVAYGERKQLSKKNAAALELAKVAPIRIISYNMMNAEWLPALPWDAIIFDEVHLLQHADSQWSASARELVARHAGAIILGLTGTLMPNKPLDLWNVVDIMWPGRFGRGWVSQTVKRGKVVNTLHPSSGFGMRYTNAFKGEYGWQFPGVNEDNAEELRDRVASFSSRITRNDIKHLLPPFQVRLVEADSGEKITKFASKWVESCINEGNNHVAILTHYRKTVAEITETLKKAFPLMHVVGITGAETAANRDTTLQKAQKCETSVIVATMHSVGRGITLGWNSRVLFAELYWRPETLAQAFGRVGRMGDAAGAIIDVLSIPGTMSERIANRLCSKLTAINDVTAHGMVEGALQKVLTPGADDMLKYLNDMSDVPDTDKQDWVFSAVDEDDEPESEVF